MIVIGYQGIGKSTLAQKDFRYVDLESSALRQGDVRWHNWYEPYCMIAEWLSRQGYTVFVSSHKEVRDYLNEFCKEPFCAVVPSEILKNEWTDKLRKRYEQFPTGKNYRAYMNAVDRYTENVREIKNDVADVREITSMNYELDRLIDKADTPQTERSEQMENKGDVTLILDGGILAYDGFLDALLDNGYTITMEKVGACLYLKYEIKTDEAQTDCP